MAREYQENLVMPINMNCYLCSESQEPSQCNYCKSQFPFHDLDDNAFKIVLYEFQHGTISYDADHLEAMHNTFKNIFFNRKFLSRAFFFRLLSFTTIIYITDNS